ncbi:hypothetical protein RRF57_001544 [Xylaria bambusicola]|uniref:Uncharacterized protein n=1 Tax=Xylaria bambusicola TaxID=326684 RepID=A0AAN7UC19_9PEZI
MVLHNNLAFGDAVCAIVRARMDMPIDAMHDFYSIVGGSTVGPEDEALRNCKIWAEAIFILPAVCDRLAREIRSGFTSGDNIQSGPQLPGCKYLRVVIDETLRITAPFTATFWREPYPSHTEPLVVDGVLTPRGPMVGFLLERWLGFEEKSTAAAEKKLPGPATRAAFTLFTLGETGCLSKAVAYQEISLVIAKTLWYFDFHKAPGKAGGFGEGEPSRTDGGGGLDEYQLYDLVVADHDGLNLPFNPRELYWTDFKMNEAKICP